jgi:hypothetical protein
MRAKINPDSKDQNDNSALDEKKLWKQLLEGYEFFSRARSIPIIGKFLFGI